MEPMNRREFVKTSAVATSAPFVLPGRDSRTDTVRVGVVGLRGRGRDHLAGFQALPGVEVTAICDVDDEVIASVGVDHEESCSRNLRAVSLLWFPVEQAPNHVD